jgi:uncharacterized protein (DUF305 family)
MKRIISLVCALQLTLMLAAPARAQEGDPAPDPAVSRLEIHFMMHMILHHRSAIAMAEMALQKAEQPELRDMAAAIIDSQQMEITHLSSWLRDWYGMEPPEGMTMPPESMEEMMPMMHAMMADMEARMAALGSKSGAEFDIAFMSTMADHHAMAIMMAAPALISGHHEDLYTLAEEMVIAQGEEIQQMDEWLQEWYGVKRPV